MSAALELPERIDVNATRLNKDFERRFWRLVEPMMDDRGCWEWIGSRNDRGYGQVYAVPPSRPMLAHRASWTINVGAIASELCILHRCDNPPCVNPAHLFLGTRVDNNRDMREKKRDVNHNTLKRTCPRGHAYDYVNQGRRRCKTCKLNWQRRARACAK
jgi:hypothetical protein